MRDATIDGMTRVVVDAESGALSLDEAERMMVYLRESPVNPPRTYADAYLACVVLVRQRRAPH